MRLSPTQRRLLRAMATGHFLKAHRDIEGRKIYRLHALDGRQAPVRRATVLALVERGLIDSNKKFPAATFWLTERGPELVAGQK